MLEVHVPVRVRKSNGPCLFWKASWRRAPERALDCSHGYDSSFAKRSAKGVGPTMRPEVHLDAFHNAVSRECERWALRRNSEYSDGWIVFHSWTRQRLARGCVESQNLIVCDKFRRRQHCESAILSSCHPICHIDLAPYAP
jgi:hypothetical protein